LKRLVLLGGGHAHVGVLRGLADAPDKGWEITLVTPFRWFTYSGMVPGYFAGHYEVDDCSIDLGRLAARARAKAVFTSASLVSLRAREVICANATVIPYDVLSIDVGSSPPVAKVKGAEQHAIMMRPLENAMKAWNRVLSRTRDGKVGAVTLVGAGAAGVELALAMEYRFRKEMGEAPPHVRIITDAASAVPEFPLGARNRLRRRLMRQRIGLHVASAVTEVGPDSVRTQHGHEFASEAVFWTAGSAAHGWIGDSGFATDEQGFLLTNDFLQSVSHPDVFAAGDCATQQGRALPKAGVFAVRAAAILAVNLRAALEGGPFLRYVTDKRYLALVSTGERHAVGVWNGISWEGDWVWRWKDRIDRRFVARDSAS
jgi:pyridine nucleotide-disulfide oxidoreductase family protein